MKRINIVNENENLEVWILTEQEANQVRHSLNFTKGEDFINKDKIKIFNEVYTKAFE